jgi:hypothetical protein
MGDNLNVDNRVSRDDVKIEEERAAEQPSQDFNVTRNVNTCLANPLQPVILLLTCLGWQDSLPRN